MASSFGDIPTKLRTLWAKLNSDPTARVKRASGRWLVLQWESQGLVVVEADVGEQVRLKHVSELRWNSGADPQDSTMQAGLQLREHLAAKSISATQTAVIVPREIAVIRRLELPNIPDEELPDLVRFQAAARTSTPLERLAIDFVPVAGAGEGLRNVLLVTMDAIRLRMIQATVEAAGGELAQVTFSPLATAELVGREASAEGFSAPAVIVWQKDANVELSLVDEGQLAFSHNIQLASGDGEINVKPLQAELTRAIVAMSQQHPGATIAKAFLLPGTKADAAVRGLLEDRFGAGLSLVEPAASVNVSALPADEEALVSRAGPALGQLVATQRPQLPAIDFLSPRKPYVAPDRRREYARLIIGAAVLVGVLGFWWYLSAMGARQADIDHLNSELASLDNEIQKGQSTLTDAQKIADWENTAPPTLKTLQDFYKFLPGTRDLYFVDLSVDPVTGSKKNADAVATISGKLYARNVSIIESFQDRLRENGYDEYEPQTYRDARKIDPDYPYEYALKLHQLSPPPPIAATAAPAAKTSP